MFATIAAVFCVSVCSFAPSAPAVDTNMNMDGDWKVTLAVDAGLEVTNRFERVIYRFKGENFQYLRDGVVVREYKWTRDERVRPFAMDLKYIGDNAEAKKELEKGLKGIYRFVDGRFERCYANAGMERPKEFESTLKNRIVFMVLERIP